MIFFKKSSLNWGVSEFCIEINDDSFYSYSHFGLIKNNKSKRAFHSPQRPPGVNEHMSAHLGGYILQHFFDKCSLNWGLVNFVFQ